MSAVVESKQMASRLTFAQCPCSLLDGVALLDQDGALLLHLLHGRGLVRGGLEEAVVKDVHGCVVHLLPTVEAAALTESADGIRESMVKIMEEHLVPTVTAAEDHRHGLVKEWPGAIRIAGQEVVPVNGMVEVHDEHPRRGKAQAMSASHREKEAPTFSQCATQRPSSDEPDGAPQGQEPKLVLGTAFEPLLPELGVALATGAFGWEVQVPKASEESPGVVGAEKVPRHDQRHGEPTVLIWPIEPVGRIPTELAMDQQVDSACVVLVMLHDDILPWQVHLVRPAMRDVLLPHVRREGRTVEHIVQAVNILDA